MALWVTLFALLFKFTTINDGATRFTVTPVEPLPSCDRRFSVSFSHRRWICKDIIWTKKGFLTHIKLSPSEETFQDAIRNTNFVQRFFRVDVHRNTDYVPWSTLAPIDLLDKNFDADGTLIESMFWTTLKWGESYTTDYLYTLPNIARSKWYLQKIIQKWAHWPGNVMKNQSNTKFSHIDQDESLLYRMSGCYTQCPTLLVIIYNDRLFYRIADYPH